MSSPLIFDIQRSSTKDGPGIRTTVFFKGCNLDCFWCHNPEGKSPKAQMAFFTEKCVSCGVCAGACKKNDGACTACGSCVETCPAAARRLYGVYYTPRQLFGIIMADKPYYDATGGGVTFSGGECMLYPEYLLEAAKLCKKNGISVAIDTAGCVPFSQFEKILDFADTFLYDIKAITPELHQRGTGKDNSLILENLDRLIAAGKEIIVRVPVIPEFNDGEELEKIKSFCEGRKLRYELLPYHEFGIDKKRAIEAFGKNTATV